MRFLLAIVLALAFSSVALAQPPVTPTPAPSPTPWFLEPQFLAAIAAVGLLLARYFGLIKDPDKTPPVVTPPVESPPPTTNPPPSNPPPAPSPAWPMTIMDLVKELLADGTISWTDVPAIIAFVTKILGNRLTVSDEAKLAVIQFIAERKTKGPA